MQRNVLPELLKVESRDVLRRQETALLTQEWLGHYWQGAGRALFFMVNNQSLQESLVVRIAVNEFQRPVRMHFCSCCLPVNFEHVRICLAGTPSYLAKKTNTFVRTCRSKNLFVRGIKKQRAICRCVANSHREYHNHDVQE